MKAARKDSGYSLSTTGFIMGGPQLMALSVFRKYLTHISLQKKISFSKKIPREMLYKMQMFSLSSITRCATF